MNTQQIAQWSIGTLLRCIACVTVFLVIGELIYRDLAPIQKKSLRFCWIGMVVGALIYLIVALSPKARNSEATELQPLQTDQSRRGGIKHIAFTTLLVVTIFVGTSYFCKMIANNRKNRGPFPISSSMFGTFAGFYTAGLLLKRSPASDSDN